MNTGRFQDQSYSPLCRDSFEVESVPCSHSCTTAPPSPVNLSAFGSPVSPVRNNQEIDAEQLFVEFQPLVRRLIRQYGESLETRNDLKGEIYYRFCLVLKAYDPDRGVPLRPYIVRQLSASIYTFMRQQWR